MNIKTLLLTRHLEAITWAGNFIPPYFSEGIIGGLQLLTKLPLRLLGQGKDGHEPLEVFFDIMGFGIRV